MKRIKKAISPLIATVMMVGLTIGVFFLITNVVIPIIQRQTEISDICTAISLRAVTEEGYTYFDTSSKELHLHVGSERGILIGGVEIPKIKGIKVQMVMTGGGGRTIGFYGDVSSSKVREKAKEYGNVINIPQGTDWRRVYVLNVSEDVGTENVVKVSVAPIVERGETSYECDFPMLTSILQK